MAVHSIVMSHSKQVAVEIYETMFVSQRPVRIDPGSRVCALRRPRTTPTNNNRGRDAPGHDYDIS
jgi:hypothetical protein